MKYSQTNEGLLSYFLYLKEERRNCSELIMEKDILRLVNRHLIDKNNAVFSEFPVIQSILEHIKSDDHLSGFDSK